MSDEENVGGREGNGEEMESNESDERQYRCRKCPGSETFTAAELDTHRARHRAEDERRRSRHRRGARGTSPSRSEVTLFREVTPVRTPSPRGPPAKRGRPAKKNRSNKTYNTGVTGNWTRGNSG
ncbi:unnamed protein product [Orchesella dallaii]|uniref:C2H2-type domain-containing protein n=1 Tax=Orchesella dallaii TaxID=48710 RepID=A0ABP1SB03_9HEXA